MSISKRISNLFTTSRTSPTWGSGRKTQCLIKVDNFCHIYISNIQELKLKLLTLPEHLRPAPVVSRVRVTRSLVWCVCFVDCSLSFRSISFGHCVVCPSIYRFWFTPLVSSNSSLYCILIILIFPHSKENQ
jgi:hypothetical protein